MGARTLRALVQRVTEARVTIGTRTTGEIGRGVLILICAMAGDRPDSAGRMASKIARLRIHADEAGKMNRSLVETGGAALVVSQFTLAADTRRGNRPGFSAAAPPDEGERLYLAFVEALGALDVPVETGRFGADMQVALVNDGPVTILLET